eukprot:g17297.t1
MGRSVLRTLTVSTALLLGSTALAAADPMAEQTGSFVDWSGFYIGVHAGLLDSATTIRDDSGELFDEEGATLYTNDLTGTLGLHGGYNWQMGNTLFGIEADYTFTDAGRSRIFSGTDHTATSQIDHYGSLRARAGVVQDNAHIYMTAGVGRVDAALLGSNRSVGGTDTSHMEDFFAAVAGVGTEVRLRNDISARLELLHYLLDDHTGTCTECIADGDVVFGGSLIELRAGLSWHFNQDTGAIVRSGDNVWSGFYAGAHVSALDSATRVQDEAQDVLSNKGTSVFTNDLSAAGGFQAGYNHVFGSALLGLEADYTFTDSGFSRLYSIGDEDIFLSSQIDGIASLRARAGVVAGNAHAYVTGGLALINGEIIAADDNRTNPAEMVTFNNLAALVVGAGVETKLTPNTSFRGEYLFYGFDEDAIRCGACDNDNVLADGEIHTFRFGINYHFNADAMTAEPAYAADWSGFYGGVHAGFLASRTGIRDETTAIFGQAGTTAFTTSWDPSIGLFAGYNHQWGNAVAGLEADYTFTNAGGSRFANIGAGNGDFIGGDIDGFGSIRGRLGMAVGHSLFYATGGIGFVNADVTAFNADDPTNEFVSYDGFLALVAGVGTEYQINDNMSLRAEYQYYGFDEQVDRCATITVDCAEGQQYADGELHILRAGFSYHWN